jgi:ribulose-5-phosphate 4-epimerase/fuculose-1-phosphate aldolase
MIDFAPLSEFVDQLVIANLILYRQGVVDGFGHVSVRNPSDPSTFLLSCNRAPALVRRRDITCYDLNGEAVSEQKDRPYLERFIHAEIYRARADVSAIVHSHSESVIPFTVTKRQLKPVFHMAGFLGTGSAHFDIREAGGNTNMLVSTPYLGSVLATSLGSHSCVLMRGHGSTVVGASLQQAVFRAIYAEVNAKLQMAAHGLGDVEFLNAEEASLASEDTDSQLMRSWNLWVQRLGHLDLDQ